MIDVMWAADDKKAILLDFHGQWNLHMLKLACKRAGHMLRAHEQRTHLILDFSENNGYLPKNALTGFHKAAEQITAQVGLIVVITVRTTLARRIAQTLTQLGVTSLHSRLIFTNSVGEALYATGSLNSPAAV